jgi:hypothetical protein
MGPLLSFFLNSVAIYIAYDMCVLEVDIRQFTYSFELRDVLGTSVTIKRYCAIHPGHQNCSYFDRKHNYLKKYMLQ